MRYLPFILAVILSAVLGATTAIALGGVPVNQPQPGNFPPRPPKSGLSMASTDRSQITVNLSPTTPIGDQWGMRVGTGPGGEMSSVGDVILLLSSDRHTADKQAADWVAANHPGAQTMLLPPQGHIEGFMPPSPTK